MKKVRIITIFFFLFAWSISAIAQQARQIDYESDRTIRNEEQYPGAFILSKVENQVHFTHQGIEVWCDQAIHYAEENFFRAFGNVKIKQGDSITMNSRYAEYNGDTQFAFASGDVRMRNPQSSLRTDTLFFDRQKQQAFYRSGGTVRDTASVLTSRVGRYFVETNKYSFQSNVVITNPEYVIASTQLDFYADNGHAYMYGPTTITSETSTVYCERGFYDTRADIGFFVKNSRIDYENRILEGDSLYFNRNTSFASATNNIKVTDTLNESVIRGHYAEVYREQDSVFITNRAVAVRLQEQDSIFIHGDTLMVTGEPDNRVIRGFRGVRIFKSDMSGKSDSIHVQQNKGLTQMLGRPVVWSGSSQLTGDTIHLINNVVTEELDSLKVYDNAFMIEKDSMGGYNQIKGKELFGYFDDNELYQVDILKNTETIYYMRNDAGELIGINNTLSSSISVFFEEQEIAYVDYLKNVEGVLYPEEEFPPNERELRGFNWRGDEQLHSYEDLFAGKPAPELVKIQGIPLPEEAEEFFDEDDPNRQLLNERSRLRPEDLQNREEDQRTPATQDTIAPVVRDSIPPVSRDTLPPVSRDTLSPAREMIREKVEPKQK